MKTIFDKVDPKYLECATGACEHTSHVLNGLYFAIAIVILVNAAILIYPTRRPPTR